MSVRIEIPKKELPKRRLVQYVFLDVVGFTRADRSDEDMARIIITLNDVVKHALESAGIRKQNRIVLPTGDGMCIALLNSKGHDAPLQLALDIRRSVDAHNAFFPDETERFQLRIAVHQNHDFILPDFNGNRNVFGQGINTVARLNHACEPSHIVVSHVVHENTRRDPAYMKLYDAPQEVLIKGQTFRYYSLGPGLGEGVSLMEIIGRYKSRIGPKLTADDIALLGVGDQIFHAAYGLGTIRSIAPQVTGIRGRQVTIGFREREHQIRLTNEKGNYHKWT
jgi:class 3 adenylate cyclase